MIDWPSVKTIAVILTAALFGGMVSYSFFVVPMLRRALNRATVRELLRRLFPAYYHYCTAFAIGAGVVTALTEYRREAVALAILGATFVFARTHLLRAIRALQPPAHEAADLRFKLVHGFSLLLNIFQMIVAAAILVRLVQSSSTL